MKKEILPVLLVLTLASCQNNEAEIRTDGENPAALIEATVAVLKVLPNSVNYNTELPAYLKVLGMQQPFVDNRKAGLGRVLFYDKNLSKDRQISCASCHKQETAFADNFAFSPGVEGRVTSRSSLPLGNVANFNAHYSSINGKKPMLFWDERVETVAEQCRQTLANPREMGMEMHEVVDRIKALDYYEFLWNSTYGHFEPKQEEVLEALQEFVGAMGSARSKLDEGMAKVHGDLAASPTNTVTTQIQHVYYGDTSITTSTITIPFFTESEDKGREIFVKNCTKCHSPIRPFQEVFAANNGLDMTYADKGLAEVTGRTEDIGVFKSPSLRNIALTAPYMHDGRFKTLEEVVDFYSEKVQPHPNLHPQMIHNGSRNLHLSVTEKANLVSFLHTLTDKALAQDMRFSTPFK